MYITFLLKVKIFNLEYYPCIRCSIFKDMLLLCCVQGAHFVELCCQRKIPLLFLQNITGELFGVNLVVKSITGFIFREHLIHSGPAENSSDCTYNLPTFA
jgi:hypothetical protein